MGASASGVFLGLHAYDPGQANQETVLTYQSQPNFAGGGCEHHLLL